MKSRWPLTLFALLVSPLAAANAQSQMSADALAEQLTPKAATREITRSMGASRGISTITPADLQSNVVSLSVEFDTDKATLRPEGTAALDTLAAGMGKVKQKTRSVVDKKLVFTFTGHTDQRGSEEHNLALSKARAEAAKRYLREVWGFEEGDILVDYKGKSQPKNTVVPCDDRCMQQNRRVDIVSTLK